MTTKLGYRQVAGQMFAGLTLVNVLGVLGGTWIGGVLARQNGYSNETKRESAYGSSAWPGDRRIALSFAAAGMQIASELSEPSMPRRRHQAELILSSAPRAANSW